MLDLARLSSLPVRYMQYTNKPAQLTGLVTHYKRPLDANLMNEASVLLGKMTLVPFALRAASPQRRGET